MKSKPGRKSKSNRPKNIPLVLERPFPQKRLIRVVTTSDGSIQAAAAGFAVVEFRLADPTDAGVAGGTGGFTVASTGILDMAAYALARVRSARIEYAGASLETGQLLSTCLILSDHQPSVSITTYALAKAATIGYMHTPVFKVAIASGNTSFKVPPVTVTARQVIGDILPTVDRDFVTIVNPTHTPPLSEWWGAVIVTSAASGINITNGLDVNITITQEVEAFSRLVGT